MENNGIPAVVEVVLVIAHEHTRAMNTQHMPHTARPRPDRGDSFALGFKNNSRIIFYTDLCKWILRSLQEQKSLKAVTVIYISLSAKDQSKLRTPLYPQ